MRDFIDTHGPQLLETAVVLAALVGIRYALRFGMRTTILKAVAKSGEAKEVGRIINLLLVIVMAVVLTAIWGVKQSELLIFATSVITVLGIGFFAEMSILSNITAFLVLFFQHPVRIGYRIRVFDGTQWVEGELKDITYFFVFIRTEERGLISLPNAALLKNPFIILNQCSSTA